jgi:cytochrome c553
MKQLLLCIGLVISAPLYAGDIDIGKAGATVCAGCHGMDGKAVAPGFPNLAGQDVTYLKNQLINFRDKSRTGGQAVIMYGMAAGLSDTDIDNLATYFSSLKP